jgi:hypothetical protein
MKDKNGEKWTAALSAHLYPGETIWALARCNSMRPTMDGIAITNARLLGLATFELGMKGPKVQLRVDDIVSFDLAKKATGTYLKVSTRSGETVSFGSINDGETDFVRHYLGYLVTVGLPAQVENGIQLQQEERVLAAETAAAHAQDQADRRATVPVVGQPLKQNGWMTLQEHASPGELPWFVLNAGGGRGLLAAFEDRLVIAKTGAMTSFMAGSFGGGRITTFPFSDITNIEYNGGIFQGVLEVLTPSYQGTANHDNWRSSNKGRNKAADDPWTLSNCLPLDKAQYKEALPRINEMQRKIVESKRPNVIVQSSAAPAPSSPSSLSDELTNLARLKQQGILDDAEFTAAKASAIARHSSG